MNKNILIAVLVAIILGGGFWYYQYGMPVGQQADMRFGDDGSEGGSVKPETALVVGESIMGKWRSTEDARFVREFKDFSETSMQGVAVDYYNDEEVTRGTYTVAMDGEYVKVVMVMQGSQSETLNFRLSKLTPETLEMTYLDRGGVLSFTYIQ